RRRSPVPKEERESDARTPLADELPGHRQPQPRVRSRALQPRRLHPKRTDHRSRFARRGRQAIRGGLREVLIALYLRQADLDGEEARALLGELRRSQPESEGAEQIVTFTPAGKRMALPLEDGAEHSM